MGVETGIALAGLGIAAYTAYDQNKQAKEAKAAAGNVKPPPVPKVADLSALQDQRRKRLSGDATGNPTILTSPLGVPAAGANGQPAKTILGG